MKDRFRDICLGSSNVMYQFTDITKSQNRKDIKMSLECMPIEQTKIEQQLHEQESKALPDLSRMKFKDWLKFPVNLDDILYQSNLDKHDKKKWNLRDSGLIPEPIGVSGQQKRESLSKINELPHEELNASLCYYKFSCQTDKNRSSGAVRADPSITRGSILNTLRKNGLKDNSGPGSTYIHKMCLAKFAPSPEGNGIDCHRHWEALYCKCIPIIEDNENIKSKLRGLPVIYTKDYSEITEEYLNEQYEKILETEYDFTLLYLSGYSIDIQTRIIERSNYWCGKMKKPRYYDN